MAVRIRSFVPADTAAIMALFHDTVRTINIRDYDSAQVAAWAPDRMDYDLWLGSLVAHHTFVADEDNQIVGFADWEDNGHLDRFYVHKDRQGLGVGKHLLDVVERSARERGIKRMFTEASITARPFFERQGYAVIAEQQVPLRGQVFTNYRMDKSLVAPPPFVPADFLPADVVGDLSVQTFGVGDDVVKVISTATMVDVQVEKAVVMLALVHRADEYSYTILTTYTQPHSVTYDGVVMSANLALDRATSGWQWLREYNILTLKVPHSSENPVVVTVEVH